MISQKIREFIYKRYNISFSKSGDDIQLRKLIKQNSPGVYVDIGCWHPTKASNTYYFYLRGWKGICIDPNPELKVLYDKIRPNDLFLNYAVGYDTENLKYYMLDDKCSSMNTLSIDFVEKKNLSNHIKKIIDVPMYSLKEILDKHLSFGERLDFFDVDVEGYDLEVLKTNDWEKYRPKVVMVETNFDLTQDLQSNIVVFLQEKQYELIGKSIIMGNLGNLFLIDKALKS